MIDACFHHRRRHWLPALALACSMALSGCSAPLLAVRDVEGVPCATFRTTYRPNRICATQPAPAAERAREVQAFAPDAASAQVLVLWTERAGATRPLPLRVDGRVVSDLVPGGLVRLRVAPGPHALSVAWGEQQTELSIWARAGEVRFAELSGRFSVWDVSFGWDALDAPGARTRAAAARVLADVDLRSAPEKVGGSVMPTP